MYAVYCTEDETASAVRAALDAECPTRFYGEWPDFERAAPAAPALAVALPESAVEGLAPRLCRLRARYPLRPLVLLAPRSFDVVRRLLVLNLAVTDVVWTDAGPGEMRDALRGAAASGILGQVADFFEQLSLPHVSLGSALGGAFRTARPPVSVAALAALSHCDRTTLWKQWRAHFGAECPVQPAHFAGWVLLIHAVVRKCAGRRWSAIAGELGVHEHTLARQARRCLGVPLGELREGGRAAVLKAFRAGVVRPLLEARNGSPGSGNDLLLKSLAEGDTFTSRLETRRVNAG